ncbi:MAG: glycoside hydrolase family 88 protein [Lachnospiraceae bacterium]|jgi:rhamnogalacturonyl hydrolase YesR|nr:glycoside hydrolase family 88 protein [Lachnospiraceae bacterium]
MNTSGASYYDYIAKIVKIAERELLQYPIISARARVKSIIYAVYKKNPRLLKVNRTSWPNTMLALALIHSETSLPYIEKYCYRVIRNISKMQMLDETMAGSVLLFMYKRTNNENYLKACSEYATYLTEHKKNENNCLFYREKSEDVLVDSLGMIVPFLSEYAMLSENIMLRDLACEQIVDFLKNGMDYRSGLPYHGYSSCEKTGIIGWGRAVGWLMMGMIGYLRYNRHDIIEKAFVDLYDKVLGYQDENGMFHWLITATDGSVDTSATAMILNSIFDGVELGLLPSEALAAVEKGAITLAEYISDDGNVLGSSGECQDLGMYPQIYGSYPWSIGPTLLLYSKLASKDDTTSLTIPSLSINV